MGCDPETNLTLKKFALYFELVGLSVTVGVTAWIGSTDLDGVPTKVILGIGVALSAVGGVLSKWCAAQKVDTVEISNP